MTVTAETRERNLNLEEIETLAVEMATLAGAEIVTALGGLLKVRYKTADTAANVWQDPVSEVDRRVETLIRARLADRFPKHDIIGEEMEERPSRDNDVIWAIDPIDGTANFVNGFPMFAASIGVLSRGRPVAGAVWCSVTHALRSGVYHARDGGDLLFEGEKVVSKVNPLVRRGLAGVPHTELSGLVWDTRKTGSAAIECALTAAGLLRVSYFEKPNLWDVAGGIALLFASGHEVRMREGKGWRKLDRFLPLPKDAGSPPDMRNWRGALVVGQPAPVAQMCDALSAGV